MSEIRFKKPWKNNTNPHTYVITFPFEIIKQGSNAEYDKKYDKEITVSITDVLLLGIWNYKESSEQDKVLFQFAINKIKSKRLNELLNEEINISLTEGNQNHQKPFDPNKIPNTEGFTIQIDDNMSKPKMGF